MYIDIHTHKVRDSFGLIQVFNLPYPQPSFHTFFSASCHPWYSTPQNQMQQLVWLQEQSHAKQMLAMGECGLDRLRGAPLREQILFFQQQIILSEQLSLPVLVHCVKAFAELLAVRKQNKARQAWLVHGFRGKVGLAKQLIAAGMLVSFGEALLHVRALQDTFVALPLTHVFLETDESARPIEDIYHMAAQLKGISLTNLQHQLEQNFNRVFFRDGKA